jgi:hypothetical protein
VALWPHTTARPARSSLLFVFTFFTSLIIRQVTWMLPYMVSSKYTSLRLFFHAAPVLCRFSVNCAHLELINNE